MLLGTGGHALRVGTWVQVEQSEVGQWAVGPAPPLGVISFLNILYIALFTLLCARNLSKYADLTNGLQPDDNQCNHWKIYIGYDILGRL